MKYKAHDYQQYATDFIIGHPMSCLILDMGLGKTVITLTALWLLLFDYFEVRRILVIAPKRVAETTWPAEIKKWEHLYGMTFASGKGTAGQRKEALLSGADVTIIGRDNVSWMTKNIFFDFDMVVIDELSSFKSPKAQRFKDMKKVRPMVKRVVGLTGTPGNLMDLWAEIGILDMGQRLGRYIGGYRDRFFLPDKRNREIIFSYKPREGAEEKIYELISDISISMKAVDYLDMPECISNRVNVSMSESEQALYDRMADEMILEYGEGQDIDAVNAAALSNKLQQMANGAVYDESGNVRNIHDRKLDVLEDLIESANGKPLLVAYWFKHDRERILKRFPARDINTKKDIEDWNEGKIPVALIHPASAGHGLNLQEGGSTIVWFSLTWSLELYQQLNARLYRQGQKHTVIIEHLVTEGTVDEDILRAIEKKDTTQNAMIEAVKARIGGMTDDGRSKMKEYKNMKKELTVTEFQLRQFQGVSEQDMIDSMLYSHQEGERVQTSTLSDKTANIAVKYKAAMERENDEWYGFLFHRYMFLKEELDFFEHAVNGLDERHRSIITDLLDKDMTWDIMMERYHVSHTMIAKYRKAALKELDKQYELRDRQVEAFVLG